MYVVKECNSKRVILHGVDRKIWLQLKSVRATKGSSSENMFILKSLYSKPSTLLSTPSLFAPDYLLFPILELG